MTAVEKKMGMLAPLFHVVFGLVASVAKIESNISCWMVETLVMEANIQSGAHIFLMMGKKLEKQLLHDSVDSLYVN